MCRSSSCRSQYKGSPPRRQQHLQQDRCTSIPRRVFPGAQEAVDEDFHQRAERPQEEWVFTFRAQTEAVSPRKRELRDYAAGTVMYYILAMTVKENVLQEFKSVEDTQELEFWRCSQLE